MRILIIGCGYVGLPLGAELSAAGHEVFGIRRDSAAVAELATRGIQFVQADITDRQALGQIAPDFDAVVNLVSSTRGGVDEYRRAYLEGTRNVVSWLQPNPPQKYISTSSTSVYGQTDGSVVTEESPTAPDSATSRILVETENELRASFPAIILRVAGIYGPERGHLFQQFLRGEATLRDDGSNFINNVHLNDVAGAIAHLLHAGTPGETYNVVDNEPVTQADFFRWLSATLRMPMPTSAPANPDRKRGLTNKRLSNVKLRAAGYSFQYPTFREGYTAEMKRLGINNQP
jgi:nucleoside-diphosphate-sugar epimerase